VVPFVIGKLTRQRLVVGVGGRQMQMQAQPGRGAFVDA
jgi:hypothetical protein